jgi:hypothetical protein
MSALTILVAVFGAALIVAYALWDSGADRLLATLACVVVRVVTFGRVRLSSDQDYSRAMGISAMTLLVIFVTFVIIASRVH